MAEEVSDLTDEEEGQSDKKGKGKQKKEKEPKPPKEKKQKIPGIKGEKKGGGAGGIIIVMILLLVLLIGGFAAAVYFDVFRARLLVADVVREPLIDLIIWLDPEFSAIDEQIRAEGDARERRLEEREENFEQREANLRQREGILDTREQQLNRRTVELDNREEQILAMYERTVPLYRRENRTEQDIEDMMSLGRTYSQMSPADAAAIMVEIHDPRDVAAILYYMSERNAAAILSAFHPEFAADITEILLYY
jgi:flagellar motility protein MotE (MotC chaperone)